MVSANCMRSSQAVLQCTTPPVAVVRALGHNPGGVNEAGELSQC